MIRALQRVDIDRCARIVESEEFFRDYGLSADDCRESLTAAVDASHDVLRVAEREGMVVGFIWFMPRGAFGRSGYTRLLAVEPGRQSQGIGRELMASIERDFLPRRDILLLVSASNHKARRFYASIGYEQCGLLDDYVKEGVAECIYRKRYQVTEET